MTRRHVAMLAAAYVGLGVAYGVGTWWKPTALLTRGQTGSVPAPSHAGLVLSDDAAACGLRRSSLIN